MTIIQELLLALRGTFSVFLGKRDASKYFDLTVRGLTGSLIAFLVALALNAYLPQILGYTGEDAPGAWRNVVVTLSVFGAQLGTAYLVLKQLGRLDGFVPYLVADNWATFFLSMISVALVMFELSNGALLLFLGIVAIAVEINIARLILTLRPLHIAMFLVAQVVGTLAVVLLVTSLGILPMESI